MVPTDSFLLALWLHFVAMWLGGGVEGQATSNLHNHAQVPSVSCKAKHSCSPCTALGHQLESTPKWVTGIGPHTVAPGQFTLA